VTKPSPWGTGRVISVVSPKGGVGKTTVATNLAVGLALEAGHSTVLVDLDLQFGDVASALDLDPEHVLTDTLYGPPSRDTLVLKTFLTLHETGLYVICGPQSPADADSITPQQLSHLLQMLASEFTYVVVDTAAGLSEHALAAMDESSDLVFVTSMDVPGVRGLRKELEALSELGMLTDSRCVVLNFTDARAGLSLADVEATIGSAVDISLPRSKAALQSVNQGVPLLQSGRRDPMTKELRRLVDRFAYVGVDAAGPGRTPAVQPDADVPPRRATRRQLAGRTVA
jgi:pilus assembly protein CpaE